MVGLTVAAWVGHRMKNWEIYTDSLSSLTMINKSRSQRDWIRTPSPGWVKHLKDFLNQNPAIKIDFVKAHTNQKDIISRGNDIADKLAKLGVSKTAHSTITLDFNGVYLSLNNKILLSGIKKDLKKISNFIRTRIWKKLSHQSNILGDFKSQYTPIYENLIPRILERGKDKIWSFFVLATLRWFTTLVYWANMGSVNYVLLKLQII